MKKIYVLLLLLIPYSIKNQVASMSMEITKSINYDTLSFTPNNLKAYLIHKGVKHPEVVYAQAVVESNTFSSRIFKENNNLVGMKYVDTTYCKKRGIRYRPTVAIGERYKHAYYASWQRCIDDYLLWQKIFKRTPMNTKEEYLKLLKRHGYAEATNYVPTLKVVMLKDTTNWNNWKLNYKPHDEAK